MPTDKFCAAVSISRSPSVLYDCNQVTHTTYGWWIQDECGTANKMVNNNGWNHHYYGILCTPLAQDGTLGDLGEQTLDHNFTFNGAYDNHTNPNDADRIYRLVNGLNNIQPKIFTNNITQNQSGANIANQRYQVLQTSTTNKIPVCGTGFTINPIGIPIEVFNQELADHILADSITYYANPIVAKWLAEQRLFEELDEQPSLLTDAAYNTFYSDQLNTPMETINNTNKAIRNLLSPISLSDATTFEQLLQTAQSTNAANVSELVYEINDKLINDIYFKVMGYGGDSLTEEEVTQLEAMAKSCPLVNGSAVYKARSLWARWQPWCSYSDVHLCNNITQAKGVDSSGIFDFIFTELATTNMTQSSTLPFKDVTYPIKQVWNKPFSISPNPSSGQITIKYQANQTGVLELYNALGQAVQRIILPAEAQTVTALLTIPNGVYSYKYSIANTMVASGKLNVIR